MRKSFISVVIPAFNEEKYIHKCLKAVGNQEFPRNNYEVIIVDNNSTDKTVEIAKSFGVKIVKEIRQGNTFALNRGMRSAKGEIIACIDADTIVFPNWLENIEKIFEDKEIVGATGPAYVKTGNFFLDLLCAKFYEYALRLNFFIGKAHTVGLNFAVRKKTFDEIGGVDENYTMSCDVDLGLRLGKKGKVIFSKDMKVIASFRRWEKNPLKASYVYFSGYIWAVWLRLPPPVKQDVVR